MAKQEQFPLLRVEIGFRAIIALWMCENLIMVVLDSLQRISDQIHWGWVIQWVLITLAAVMIAIGLVKRKQISAWGALLFDACIVAYGIYEIWQSYLPYLRYPGEVSFSNVEFGIMIISLFSMPFLVDLIYLSIVLYKWRRQVVPVTEIIQLNS